MEGQPGFASEQASEMKSGAEDKASDLVETEIFGEAGGKQKAGPLCQFAMRLERWDAPWGRDKPSLFVGLSNHLCEEFQGQLIRCQTIVHSGKGALAKTLMKEKETLAAKRV